MNVFEQVRTIVDARIKALALRREVPGGATMMACRPVVECDEAAYDRPCGRHTKLREAQMALRARLSPRLPEDIKVPPPDPRPPNLHAANLSFAARVVIAVRDKFQGDAPKVYTAAKVSRQAYSQIISDETRPVSKRTAIRFAFALRSTPEDAKRLLKSAGYAFSNSQTEDFILQACLEVNPPIWDLDSVNKLLQEYRVDFQY